MARGRKAQETRSRERDTRRRAAEFRHVSADGEARGIELPDGVLPNGEEWHPRTVAWWNTWRYSAQAATFLDTDWDFLLDTALMHHTMWTKGRWEFAGEIRLRVSKFGATPEDRMRLRLKVDTTAESAEPDEPDDQQSAAVRRRQDLRIIG